MIAYVINRNLNSRGGSARVCISTSRVLKARGFRVRLLTKTPVNWQRVHAWGGGPIGFDEVADLEPLRVGAFGRYQKFLASLPLIGHRPDVLVNTSGDFFPFLHCSGGSNISYCHFPVVRLIDANDTPEKYSSSFWSAYYRPYRALLNNAINRARSKTLFLTNSNFSKDAIRKYLGADSRVVYPPVAVEKFQTVANSSARKNSVATVARFNASKKIDLIFEVLPELRADIDWHVIGSLNASDEWYFKGLVRKSRELGLEGRLHFHPNASESEFLAVLSTSKVYFHPTRGEHFGISIVESMAAGLVPVVWNYGGCSEIAPEKWQFSSVEEAVERISLGIEVGSFERRQLSKMAERFSEARFSEEMTNVIQSAL